MTQYLLEVSLSWIILYSVFFLFLRKETFFRMNRWYLLTSLGFGLILPLLKVFAIDVLYQLQNPVDDILYGIQILPQQIGIQSTGDDVNQDQWLLQIVQWLYWTGVVILSARLFYGLWQIYVYFQEGIHEPKSGYCLIRTEEAHLPFSFFRYVFVSENTELIPEYRQILEHELEHVRHRHSIDVLIIEMLTVVFWFNPIIYLYKTALRQTHEYLADQAVIQNTDKKMYGHILLRQSLSGIQIALAHHFFHSHLKNRINMIFKPKSGKRAILRYFLFFPVVAILGMAFINSEHTPLTSGVSSDQQYSAVDTLKPKKSEVEGEEIFKIVEQMPLFGGCSDKACSDKKLIEYIFQNLKYPSEARSAGIQGKVFVQFVVETDGSVDKVKVVRDIGGGCGEAVVQLIHKMNEIENPWKAGVQRGKKVRVLYTIPVAFRMEETAEESNDNLHEDSEKNELQESHEELHEEQKEYNQALGLHEEEKQKKDKAFKEVDQMPLFGNCNTQECSNKSLVEFIIQHMKYPKVAKDNKVEGRVFIQFVVETDGRVGDIQIVRDIGAECGKVAKSIIQKMNELETPPWIPGIKDNQLVRTQMILPFTFKLPPQSSNTWTENTDLGKTLATPGLIKGVKGDPLLVVDGEIQEDRSILESMDPKGITTINIWKDEKAVELYGSRAKDGVIEVETKGLNLKRTDENTWHTKEESNESTEGSPLENVLLDKEPLLVIDGEIRSPGTDYREISPDEIVTVNVLGGEKAIDLYGEKAKNGVIEITMKKSASQKEESLKVVDEVTVFDAQDYTETATLQERSMEIKKNSSERLQLSYDSLFDGDFTIILSDVQGRRVKHWNKSKKEGVFTTDLNVSNVQSGIYILSVEQRGEVISEKFTAFDD